MTAPTPISVGAGERTYIRTGGHAEVHAGGYGIVLRGAEATVLEGGYAEVHAGGYAIVSQGGQAIHLDGRTG